MRKPRWFRGEWRPSRGPSSTHGVPRKYIEGSLKIFLRQTLGQRPRVCLRKIFWEPSIYSHGTPLSSLVNLPRGSIHHDTTSAYSQIVPGNHISIKRIGVLNFHFHNLTTYTFLRIRPKSLRFFLFLDLPPLPQRSTSTRSQASYGNHLIKVLFSETY